VDEDRPQPAEHDHASDGVERQAERDARQVLHRLGQQAVDRVLAMSRQPVEVLGGVVHAVEAPKDLEAMRRTVKPVHDQIADAQGEDDQQPQRPGPGLLAP
jgi:hypothetical protein